MPSQDLQNSKVDLLSTKLLDMHGRQIKNLADGTDQKDAVNLSQLTNKIDIIKTIITSSGGTGSTTSAANAYETPTGTLNGTNTVFTLSNTPSVGSFLLFLNGVEQLVGTDYTLSGSTITYVTAPKSADWHLANYNY